MHIAQRLDFVISRLHIILARQFRDSYMVMPRNSSNKLSLCIYGILYHRLLADFNECMGDFLTSS